MDADLLIHALLDDGLTGIRVAPEYDPGDLNGLPMVLFQLVTGDPVANWDAAPRAYTYLLSLVALGRSIDEAVNVAGRAHRVVHSWNDLWGGAGRSRPDLGFVSNVRGGVFTRSSRPDLTGSTLTQYAATADLVLTAPTS